MEIIINFPTECPICMTCDLNVSTLIIIAPCKHIVCSACYRKLDNCPICRVEILSCINLFSDNMFNLRLKCLDDECIEYDEVMSYPNYLSHLNNTRNHKKIILNTPTSDVTPVASDSETANVASENQRVTIRLDDAQKKIEELNVEWTISVTAHEVKNQEMIIFSETAYISSERDVERKISFARMIDERYMCLVDAYKKLEALTSFVVNVNTGQLNTYNDVLVKIRDDANACSDCLCKKHFAIAQ